MSAFTEFLINTLSGALTTIGESKLEQVLQQLHDKNPAEYEAAIRGGHALVVALLPLTQKTGTKIDDAFINALEDALNVSAAANGITL